MNPLTHILHLEDDALDAELIRATLESAGIVCQITRVQNRDEFTQALQQGEYDIILADYRLPVYDGVSALRLAQELRPEVPFIFVSGTLGEDAAVDGLIQGATDYVLKQRLSRLVPAVERALRETENRRERQRAEETVHLQSTALEAAANGIVITDRQGTILWVNPAFARLTGYTVEETIGQNPRILKSNSQDPVFYQNLWSTILSGQIWHSDEVINRRKDGTLYMEEMTITPVQQMSGEISHFIAIKQDVTDRKRAEEALQESESRYRLLAENASDIIFTMGLDLRFTYISPSVTRIRGYTIEEAMAQTIDQMLTPASLERTLQVFTEELAIEASASKQLWRTRTLELEEICKDGSTLWTETTLAPLRDSASQAVGAIGITRDITERKRTQEALRESETKFRAVFESSVDAIGVSKVGVHTFVNLVYLALFGYADSAELIGNPILDLIAPDRRAQIQANVGRRSKDVL